jgi:hypothetical protein
MDPDGTLTVTTPSGVTRTTRPPGLDSPDLARQVGTSASGLPAGTQPSDERPDEPPPF